MTDSRKPPKAGIPSWQQKTEEHSADVPAADTATVAATQEPIIVHDSQTTHQDESDGVEPVRSSYSREEVRRFLDDPGVKDAPEDKKRSFLEGKGVSKEIVDEVLLAQAAEADTGTQQQQQGFQISEFKAHNSPPPPPRDTPPIVTYPEFLVKPQKPPPLVTVGRLLNTAYVAGSLAAAFYGVSKYLIEPMTDDLIEARHEFATHTAERVEDLNAKLAGAVSKVPEPKRATDALADGTESVTSDPTELFYTDVGVQTSPPHSRRSSSASSAVPSVAEQHAERLRRMRAHLDTMLDAEVSNRDTNGVLDHELGQLREYLNGLAYAPPAAVVEYGVWTTPEDKKRKKDAVGELRDEIRGVKGVLLSARRFPARNAVGRVN
ncbi:hypothetical protein ANO11243_029180 [Dothideomycetidae sp. 11243]|nr:hypothetical protein ANO11243_029180 [fungal sp. No.11243]